MYALKAKHTLTRQLYNNQALANTHSGTVRYAETWDIIVGVNSFIQFNLAMGCDSTYNGKYKYVYFISNTKKTLINL